MVKPYRNRTEAGRALAGALSKYAGRGGVQVLALPRGGVPVGYEVAAALGAPLDVYLVRKLGVPGHEELAMGAIAQGDVRVLNEGVIADLALSAAIVDEVASVEAEELARRARLYRGERPALDLRDRIVIVVDDGLATGATMRAAVGALRREGPARVVVAVPVAASSTCQDLRPLVDDLVCLMAPDPFHAVGLWYDDFAAPSDGEIRALLNADTAGSRPADSASPPHAEDQKPL